MECLRFFIAIIIRHCTHSREDEHCSRYLSQLEMDTMDMINLKSREDILTKPIEVNIVYKCIAQEEIIFFETTDQDETTEKELWKRKVATRRAFPNDPPVNTVSCIYS